MNRREFAAALASLAAFSTAFGGAAVASTERAAGHPRLLVSVAEWTSLAARRKADH